VALTITRLEQLSSDAKGILGGYLVLLLTIMFYGVNRGVCEIWPIRGPWVMLIIKSKYVIDVTILTIASICYIWPGMCEELRRQLLTLQKLLRSRT